MIYIQYLNELRKEALIINLGEDTGVETTEKREKGKESTRKVWNI